MKREKCSILWCKNLATANGRGGFSKFCSTHKKLGYKVSDLSKNKYTPKHKCYYERCVSTIQSGIPIPEKGLGRYPFGSMKIGNSIEVQNSVSPECIRRYEKKFSIRLLKRKVDVNKWRIWRIS